jgi:hypothetical protein
MAVTKFPLVAAGWRAAVGFAQEQVYGLAPFGTGTGTATVVYTWVGAVQEMKGTVDKNPIFVYRMDGSTSYPAYILKGQRNVEFTITYWPQNIGGGTATGSDSTTGILWDMINAVNGTSGASLSPPVTGISHAFIIKDFDTGAVWTVTGAIANTVTVSGKTGAALEVKVDYWCQNIMQTLPAYVSFPTDPGNVPFFFSQEAVQIPTGTVQPQALTFTGTITNNLFRVPQFGTDVIRSIPTLTRKAEGDMTATFASMTDSTLEGNIPPTAEANAGTSPYTTTYTDPDNTLSGLAYQTIRIILGKEGLPSATSGTFCYMDWTGAVLPKIDLTVPIADRVALDLPWTATGCTVHT